MIAKEYFYKGMMSEEEMNRMDATNKITELAMRLCLLSDMKLTIGQVKYKSSIQTEDEGKPFGDVAYSPTYKPFITLLDENGFALFDVDSVMALDKKSQIHSEKLRVKAFNIHFKKIGRIRNILLGDIVKRLVSKIKKGDYIKDALERVQTQIKFRFKRMHRLVKDELNIKETSHPTFATGQVEFAMLKGLVEGKSLNELTTDVQGHINLMYKKHLTLDTRLNEGMKELQDMFKGDMWRCCCTPRGIVVSSVKINPDETFETKLPLQIYKTFDDMPAEWREELKTTLIFCRINREQKGISNDYYYPVIDTMRLFPWDDKVYTDSQSVTSIDHQGENLSWIMVPRI
jgi:hypothetical protein